MVELSGHSGEALYNILAAGLSKKEAGWFGESPVLAQRAVADSPRWTRAVGDSSEPSCEGEKKRGKMGGGSGQVPFLLAERAR
jgi:hypothetical protein